MEPLTDEKWGEIKEVIAGEEKGLEPPGVKSETTSVNDVATKVFSGEVGGIVVDANRELRAKLYIGQVGPFVPWFASLTQGLDLDIHGLVLVYTCIPLRPRREDEGVEAYEERGGLSARSGERYHRR